MRLDYLIRKWMTVGLTWKESGELVKIWAAEAQEDNE